MNRKNKFTSSCLALAVAAASIASSFTSYGQGASATISDTPVSGGFDYTIVLLNTGSTNLNGFWYAWTDSGNNLTAAPSSPANTLGWGNSIFFNGSIQWQNSTGTALAPGDTGTFTFFSTSTPTEITTPPSGESVVYVHTIGFNQAMPGISSPVFSPTLVTVPEPSQVALLSLGSLGLLATSKRWRRGSSAR